MLRKCKLEVVVAESVHCYNEITKSKEDFIMKLSDKIVRLRKSNGMSQEELADKLGVSRQAISRWEMGTAMPDATNILQLSRLFQVTTDYLLNDEYQSDNDLPKVKEVKTDGIHQIMIFLITLEVMVLIIQFMSVMILQNIFFGVLSFIPFIAMVGGFEYAYQKKANEQNERTVQFRKRFYKVSAWLGAYFPIRLLAMALVHFYPRPINSLALECVIAVLYLMTAMADVELTSVDWLWFPYIPFGKLTIIQGNPGEGKTYFAMRLAAACTNRKPLPGMETLEPFNIIYQTAEDGLGDTVKPRLMEADADLERVLVIDDRDTPLTLADERIARAIRENNARLVIIDPVQAFLGADVDMNRANEVRPIFRSLGDIAQATGCAIVLIGHLNKAAGTQSTYRGLGSIDITAAVRSLLFIGKLKDSPTTRVLIHEKSSLAPPGQSLAFSLGDEKGFEWIGAYDITADELLAGTDTTKTESKTAQAQMLILELLADGKRMPSAELEKTVNERGISSRTMRTAKSRIGDRLVTEKDGTAWVCYLRD